MKGFEDFQIVESVESFESHEKLQSFECFEDFEGLKVLKDKFQRFERVSISDLVVREVSMEGVVVDPYYGFTDGVNTLNAIKMKNVQR